MKSNGRATSVECQSQNTENTWISSTESLDVKSPPSEIKPRKLSSHSQKLSLKGAYKHFAIIGRHIRDVSAWAFLERGKCLYGIATRKDGRPIDTQVQNIPRFQAVQRRVLEHKRSHKLTRVVFSVISAFVLCMAPNQILNLVYLIQVNSCENHQFLILFSEF